MLIVIWYNAINVWTACQRVLDTEDCVSMKLEVIYCLGLKIYKLTKYI